MLSQANTGCMGLKEETVQGIGFQRLAISRPEIIAGDAHTPRYVAWLGRCARKLARSAGESPAQVRRSASPGNECCASRR